MISKIEERKDGGGEKREEKKEGGGCRKDGVIKTIKPCAEKAVSGQVYSFYWSG